ncbi:MAG: PaaX family transcriptional regulator C-terminal domain-containing protein [Mycobacteriales bacterium]
MRARAALFDVFGDYLRSRGDAAPIAALLRLLAPLGVTAPAVRTAVSRMVRQGWLTPAHLPDGPGYRLTARGVRRLDDAGARIYRTGQEPWDGRWHLLVVAPPAGRGARLRLSADLAFLGYGAIEATTWLAARQSPEVAALIVQHGARVESFVAVHTGDPRAMIDRAWDLDQLAAAYARFVDDLTPVVGSVGPDAADEDAFAARTALVHGWRNFLFTDPELPAQLLPPDWAGTKAAAFFDTEASRLLPAAARFVDSCLRPAEQDRGVAFRASGQ